MARSIRLTLDGRTDPERLSERVVDALARSAGVDVSTLDLCLYDYVDPSALDALFSHGRRCGTRTGTVSFLVGDARVTCTVTADGGTVRVDPCPCPDEGRDDPWTGRSVVSNAD